MDAPPMPGQTSPGLKKLNPEDAAKHLGISRRQLDRLWARGEGPTFYQPTEHRRWCLESDLDAYLERVRRTPSAG